MLSCCIVCNTPFKEGDALQARAAKNDDSIKRKHANCFPSYFEEIK